MTEKADIVVIGGGISGCAMFYELSRAGLGKIALVESGELASATTGESGGYIRKFNTDPYLGKLASESFDYYQNFAKEVGGNCEFHRTGMVSRVTLADLASLKGQIEALQATGYEIKVSLTPPTDTLSRGKYGDTTTAFVYEPSLGNIDTRQACRAWVAAARKNKVGVYENRRVEKILTRGKQVYGIQTNNGIIESPTVILSAGAWSQGLLAPLPIDASGISARSFQYNIYVGAAKYLDTAFMDNVEGFYTAPFRNGNIFVGTLGQDRLVENSSFDHPNDTESAERLHSVMQKHFSWVNTTERFLVKRSYDAYTEDRHGIVKTFNELPGLVLATGWSSGGIKSAPAIAKEVTRMVLNHDFSIGGIYANTKS